MSRVLLMCITFASGWVEMAADVRAVTPLAADPARQLTLDSRLFEKLSYVRLAVGRAAKDPGNPLMRVDKPWENSLNNLYPNVDYDPQQQAFHMWYKCVLVDAEAIARMDGVARIHNVGWISCYATSRDGERWEKPALGQHRYDGSTENNIATVNTGGFGVFRDPADPDPARRFKMVYDVEFDEMRVRFSPDGRRWSAEFTPDGLHLKQHGGRTGDTHSNAFWDPRGKRYVLITRNYLGERLVARSESRDFLHWTEPKVVLRSTREEGKNHQTYCMTAFPYANVYLGLVMMYHVAAGATVDCELVWSPDTVEWTRVAPGQPLIPLGPPGSCDAGCIYAQAGPPFLEGERIALYYGGSQAVHRGWKRHCLPCRLTLRKDGFAGLEPVAVDQPGVAITRLLRLTGSTIAINADLRGGSLRATLLDTAGQILAESQPIAQDAVDLAIPWTNGGSLTAWQGKLVRLRLEWQRGTLFSFTGLEQRASAGD